VDRVRAAVRLCGWARRAGIDLDPSATTLIALLTDQPRSVAIRCLNRLAYSGEPARRILDAAMTGALGRQLEGARWRSRSEIAEALRSRPVQVLAGAWIRGGRQARRRIEWFLRHGRSVRSRLSGDEVVALGVPPGPAVGRCLTALRRLRLDGMVKTRSHERALVETWVSGRARDPGGPRSAKRRAVRISGDRGRPARPRTRHRTLERERRP